MALVLAGVLLLAAERTARRPELVAALGAYAIGVIGALALGCAVSLRDAWLTGSLSLLLAATAWVGRRLGLPAVRRPAWVLAVVVLVRLGADVDLLPAREAASALHVAYAYGVPLAAFALAARWSRRGQPDPLADFLVGGALLLWLLLLATRPHRRGTGWHAGARPGGDRPRRRGPAGHGVRAAALAPGGSDGPHPALRLADARDPGRCGPAGGSARLGEPAQDRGAGRPLAGPRPATGRLRRPGALAVRARPRGRAHGSPLAGHLLAFVWLTLEVRHWFQGPSLRGPTGEAEWLAYSAAWLAWAALLLGLGVRLDRRPLRVAALAIAAVAIAKAFLFDLAELGGLYRAASFLALGLCLVGVGWLYRRLVGPAPSQAELEKPGLTSMRRSGKVAPSRVLERESSPSPGRWSFSICGRSGPATWRWRLASALQGSSRTVTA